MSPVGGFRARLIKDNLYNVIFDGLQAIGWFDGGRNHDTVTVVSEPINNLTEILPNKVGLDMDSVSEEEVELGSTLADNTWLVFVDIMAESSDLGLHLSTDIKDILLGRMASIGRTSPTVSVLDLSQATPTEQFVVQIGDLEMERDKTDKPHRKFWWTIGFNVEDTYMGEGG